MDKKKSILNVSVSVVFQIVTLILSILTRRVLILNCGNEVNGLNALYLSIIGFLSVAELGVGSAITFCMYKPIVEGDQGQVSALYQLFRRLYLIIGAVILVCGLALTPFLHHFAKDYANLDVDLYTTFLLMLVSVVLSYLFGAKTSLINAHKNNYITTAITSGGIVLQRLLQIVVVMLTHSFAGYLVCRIISVLVQWSITELVTHKKYSGILKKRQQLDPEVKETLIRSIKAMFMHKIGTLLVLSSDSLIISAFIGVSVLGEYTNYTSIQDAMAGVLSLVFSSLTSIVGHLFVKESKEKTVEHCQVFHTLNFILGTVFFLGYYAIIDDLVAILFSADLVVSKSISFTIALNGFVLFMRKSILLFRDATGTFYYDRWKPLIEGMVNVVLSILCVKWFGVTGVIAATILTNLLICHVVEPYVLYRHAFSASPKGYYLQNYGMILLFTAALLVLQQCLAQNGNYWLELFANGCISLALSLLVCVLWGLLNPQSFRQLRKAIQKRK